MYLEMANDGNLVLYTSDNNINCQNIKSNQTGVNQMGGGIGANAIYEVSQVGNVNSMGDIAYVDIDSTIYSYPETNISFGTTYTEFINSDSPGNDILNAAKSGTTINDCKQTCNSNKDCYGFVFNNQTKTCYPKGKGMYPIGQRTMLNNNIANLYVRDKTVTNNTVEGMETMNNIDTIRYDNYKDSDKDIKHRKKVADMVMTTSQKQQLDQIYSRLNLLGNEISKLTSADKNEINKITNQIKQNNKHLFEQVNEYNLIDEYSNVDNMYEYLGSEDRNLENILKDSNLNVLHENYNYILWTSLALGTLLITLNVAK
jgi:hypothetical protein